MNKQYLKAQLRKATGCTIQHDGWPCGTCFFRINDSLSNADWQAVLLTRGDYKKEDLDNLPQNIEESLKKVASLCN